MKIGMTYDLRSEYLALGYGEEETAEFDRDETVLALENALRELGHSPERIGNVHRLVERLAAGQRFDLVFNICEGLHGIGREAQVPALLDAYEIPYTFSDALVSAITLHKGMAKTVVAAAGVPTPRSCVVEGPPDLDRVALRYPLFAKPLAEGTGKGVTAHSKVAGPAALEARCRFLWSEYRQPVLVEEFLPGREFTTGILGTGARSRVLGTMEIVLRPEADAEVYSYRNKEFCEELVEYRFPRATQDPEVREAEAVALAAWRALGCRDAGRVDLRCDAAGRVQFLEVNPLAGLHPEHSDLPILCTAAGMPYRELVRSILDSACLRVPARAGAP